MSGFAVILTKALSLIFAIILMPISGITYGIDALSSNSRTDINRTNVVGIGAYFRSQGMTSDGENLYFSSKTTLICTKDDAKTTVNMKLSAIPNELKDLGIKHIGGLSYYKGKIYAGLEDSKVWKYPIVGVYDAETLELENYYILDSELITRGLPWVAVNPEEGCLYCTDHSKKPTKLLCFGLEDMTLQREIPLSDVIPSIQGGEFFEGKLYVATNDETGAIYKIDTNSGIFEKVLDRNLTGGSEGEGMTFIYREGKPVLLAMDMGPLFVNAFVREYNFN